VVGRPNVGKSTLVNRLAMGRDSIVGPVSGLTRDRLETEVSWSGRTFLVNDTGGITEAALNEGAAQTISGKVAEAAAKAMQTADVVLFIVDGKTGVTADDLTLARRLRTVSAPVIVVANKVDNAAAEIASAELWSLGLGEPMPVSALHGRGSGDLLDRVIGLLPASDEAGEHNAIPAIAIVGRPNVGKSSLFNRLVGEQRAIVHAEPGTTRDSVDSTVTIYGRTYRFVDTAGIRRGAKTHGVEVYSASRTEAAIERADVAILVIDAEEGATAQDRRIARQIADAGVGAVLVLNKWDLIDDPEKLRLTELATEDRLQFVDYASVVRVSATTGRGLGKVVPEVDRVLAGRALRITTAALNELVHETQAKSPPPRIGTGPSKVLYATQVSAAPPTFVLFTSGPIVPSWQRFLERRLREEFGFPGNPIHLVIRERERRPGPPSRRSRS
jgi:GTP-binding protein